MHAVHVAGDQQHVHTILRSTRSSKACCDVACNQDNAMSMTKDPLPCSLSVSVQLTGMCARELVCIHGFTEITDEAEKVAAGAME